MTSISKHKKLLTSCSTTIYSLFPRNTRRTAIFARLLVKHSHFIVQRIPQTNDYQNMVDDLNRKRDCKIFNSIWLLSEEIKTRMEFEEHPTIVSIYFTERIKHLDFHRERRDACLVYTRVSSRHHCTKCHKKRTTRKLFNTIRQFLPSSLCPFHRAVFCSKQFIRMPVTIFEIGMRNCTSNKRSNNPFTY